MKFFFFFFYFNFFLLLHKLELMQPKRIREKTRRRRRRKRKRSLIGILFFRLPEYKNPMHFNFSFFSCVLLFLLSFFHFLSLFICVAKKIFACRVFYILGLLVFEAQVSYDLSESRKTQ